MSVVYLVMGLGWHQLHSFILQTDQHLRPQSKLAATARAKGGRSGSDVVASTLRCRRCLLLLWTTTGGTIAVDDNLVFSPSFFPLHVTHIVLYSLDFCDRRVCRYHYLELQYFDDGIYGSVDLMKC